jgi:hypothetical protein
MKRQTLLFLASLAAAFTPVVWSVPASADIVFSTLGPGNTYSGGGLNVTNFAFAVPFTPTANFTLTQLDAGMLRVNVSNPTIMLTLEGTSSGLPSGIPLESFTVGPNLPFCFSTSCVIEPSQIVMSTSSVELLAGNEYWVVSSLTSGGNLFWGPNNIGATGTVGSRHSSESAFSFSTSTLPALPSSVRRCRNLPRSACWRSACSVPDSQDANAGADR